MAVKDSVPLPVVPRTSVPNIYIDVSLTILCLPDIFDYLLRKILLGFPFYR